MKHLEGQFKGCDGLNLYYQGWLPDYEPKAILLIVHGLAEHSGRYHNLVNYLVPRGYAVYGFDQRGHGKSDGVRGYVDRFSSFVDDLDIILRQVRRNHGDVKLFLVGHSVGGTVATAYTILHQNQFNGLILSEASLGTPHDVATVRIFAARILSLILPKVGLYFIDADGISQDKSVVKAYLDDPAGVPGKDSCPVGC